MHVGNIYTAGVVCACSLTPHVMTCDDTLVDNIDGRHVDVVGVWHCPHTRLMPCHILCMGRSAAKVYGESLQRE
jgi:hypothetical protein